MILIAAIFPGSPALASADDLSVTVLVKGLSGAKKKNVETALELPAGIVRNGKIEENWLQRYIGKIPENVDHALQPFGYYNSRSSSSIVEDAVDNTSITVEVDPGPATIIRNFELKIIGEGAGNKTVRGAQREFPLKQGDLLDHQVYEQGKIDLLVKINDAGYIETDFQVKKIQVFPQENVADIELVVDTGPLFFFGDVRFVEETEMFQDVYLHRFLAFREGEVFSHKKLHQSRINFYAANRFKEVLMVPLREEAVGRVIPIEVKLVPGKMQRLRPGIGYGTDTGARVKLSYQHMNIHEGPHALLLDLNIAEKQQSAETSYIIPREGSANDNLILTLGYLKEDLDTYDTKKRYGEIERSYGLGSGKSGAIVLGYFHEDYKIGVENDDTRVLMPALRYRLRAYDDSLKPTRGYQLRATLQGSHDALVSDLTLVQLLGAGSFMYPISPRLTLHTRIEGATTIKDDEFAKIPPTLRFFVGGDNSVRGYPYKSRGPRDKNGDVIGGDAMLVGSVECEYALTSNWGVAVFYDVGSAFNKYKDSDFIEGAGFGIRRYTPIGPIKVDFAHRLNENHTVRIHIGVGFDI